MARNIWLSTADGNYGTAANWSLNHLPTTGEDVIIPAGSPAITDGLDQASEAIKGFFVEDGYDQTIGDATEYLSIDPDSVFFAGSALAFINVNAASITVDVHNTARKIEEYAAGLYLLGSSIDKLNIYKGDVGLAISEGETATVVTVNLMYLTSKTGESSLIVGDGVTLTTWNQTGGMGVLEAAATTVTATDGELIVRGSGAVITLNVEGATVYPESTGLITTLNMRGGRADFTRSRASRTVTTPNIWPGARLDYDPNVVTFTNGLDPQVPVTLRVDAPS